MNKKHIFILLIVLAVAALVFLFVTEQKKKKAAKSIAPQLAPVVPINKVPALATNPLYGQANTYPVTQPIQAGQAGNSTFPLGVGSTGVWVKMVQAALGLKVDGKYGPNTDKAVKNAGIDLSTYQKFVDKFVTVNAEQYKKCFPLKKGSKNNYVKALQILFNLTPDGNFGAKTEAVIIAATGKSEIYHLDYTTLIAAQSGGAITYNTKPMDASKIAKIGAAVFKNIPLPGMGVFGLFS